MLTMGIRYPTRRLQHVFILLAVVWLVSRARAPLGHDCETLAVLQKECVLETIRVYNVGPGYSLI